MSVNSEQEEQHTHNGKKNSNTATRAATQNALHLLSLRLLFALDGLQLQRLQAQLDVHRADGGRAGIRGEGGCELLPRSILCDLKVGVLASKVKVHESSHKQKHIYTTRI